MIRFENTDIDFDVTDADTFEAVENLEKVWKTSLGEMKEKPSGDSIRAVNSAVKEFLDVACGKGVHESIFGGRTSLIKTYKVWNAIIGEVARQTEEMKAVIAAGKAE